MGLCYDACYKKVLIFAKEVRIFQVLLCFIKTWIVILATIIDRSSSLVQWEIRGKISGWGRFVMSIICLRTLPQMDFQDKNNETTPPIKDVTCGGPARHPAYHLRQVYKKLAILGLNVVPGTWKLGWNLLKRCAKGLKCLFHCRSAALLLSMRFGYALCHWQITDVI